MSVVAGLGNPGPAYADSRHNVGFMVVEELARRWGVTFEGEGREQRTACARLDGELVILVEPQMYMNMSGVALARLGFCATAAELIIVHDDLDLECGRVQVKCGGGTAGHRGLESIAECFGSEFSRVRLGIGRPPPDADAAAYVLSRFAEEEREVMVAAVHRAASAVECILREGAQTAMNTFNVRTRGGSPAPAAPSGRK